MNNSSLDSRITYELTIIRKREKYVKLKIRKIRLTQSLRPIGSRFSFKFLEPKRYHNAGVDRR